MQTKSSRLIYSVIALLALILTTGICSADDVNVEFVTRIGGQIQDVAIKDHYAYIGQGKDLVILDISNVSNPSEIGRLMTTSAVNTVIVAGNYTYITNAEGDLLIADISNPAAPTVSGSYDIAGYAQDAAVSGNYAYVTNNLYDDEYHGRLEIINISNASAPTLIQSYDTVCWTHGVATLGNYVYIADGDCGLLILNITNPSSPILAGSYDTANAFEVAVVGNYAYVGDESGLEILDVANPATINLLGSYDTSGYISGVDVANNYVYLADQKGLEILDVTNPATPNLLGGYVTSDAVDITVSSKYVYVADSNGLLVLDISTPSSPKLESKYDIACDTSDVAISDNYAYIADGINGLEIFDVSNPSAPELIGRCEINGSAHSIILSGDYAYITTSPEIGNDYSLVIVDVSNPSSPSIVGKYDNDGLFMNIDVAGNYAYITNGYNNISIVNVANPSAPKLAGKYETEGSTLDVSVSDKYAYVIVYDLSDPNLDSLSDLVVLDITNASSPKYMGHYGFRNNDESMAEVSVSGNYVYVSISSQIIGNGHLDILDVSTPSSPKCIGGYEGDVGDFTISGNYMYLDLGWDNGLSIVDISDPSSPTIAGGYYLGGWANDIEVSGNYVHLRDNNQALTILRVDTAPTSTVSYTPVYDNRLRASSPNTVLSNSIYIDIGKSTSSSRDVMWFNLSDYKKTDKISKAILSLYWYYPASTPRTSDTVVEVYRPMQWDPQYVSWNKRMSGAPWTTAGGNWYDKNNELQGTTPYASVTFKASKVPDDKYYDFDVTQLVQEYVNETYENTGFFLKAKTEGGNYIAFYSSDWSIAAQKPKLTVTRVSDNPPVAEAGPDKTVTTGEIVTFKGGASTDDNGIVSYSWDFDDSDGITSEATGVAVNKTYTTAGNYTVTLTVTDTIGQKSSDTLKVLVTGSSSVIYTPDYDNRLRASSPNTVLSTTTYIDVGKSTSSSRDVLLFDLSAYKPTDAISKATLSLYWYYPPSATRTSDTVVEVYRPVEWDPNYVTWNSRISGVPWTTAGGNWYDKNSVAQGTTPYASATFKASTVPDNKYYEFDVTQLVQDYVSGKYTNTGFFLKAKTESGNYIAFYSSDWSNDAQKPKLTITKGSASVDNPPVANAGTDKIATVGSAVIFNGSASTDDKGIVSYSWDFDASNGINTEATGVTATKVYATAGNYTVTLTVTDTIGQKSSDTLKVAVTSSTSIYAPIYDNRLRASSPNTVLSTATYIDVGKSTSSSRDVLLFDLSAYKATDTISKATLSLYWYYPPSATRTSDTIVEVYRPVEWDPNYVTWNNRMAGVPWTIAGGNWYDKNGVVQGTTPYASMIFKASTVPDNKYYDFDVTQLVQEYVSGKYKNTGFFLKAKTESGNYIAFYSSDWSEATQKPKLTITS
jgi:PKD repeat protein